MNKRLVSLDAFRGLTIAGMILVNNPGDWGNVYAPLLHAPWHGWTPTDLIFPFFLFIVGVSMSLSLKRQQAALGDRGVYLKIARRVLILFGLGLFLNGFPFFDLSTLRIPGVLQRIALAYGAAAVIMLHTSRQQQAYVMAAILFIYWALLTLVPVPGYGAGDLSAQGNLGAYIDRLLFTGHMWKTDWDPEGLLSTLPAVATTLSGVLAGYWLQSERDPREIAGWLFTAGWLAILAGLFWGIFFPINKNIWTSSYVVFTSGAALQFLGFCYWLIDVQLRRKWATTAIIYGMNSITVFVLSGVLARTLILLKIPTADGAAISLKGWLYASFFISWLSPVNASLGYALANVLVLLGLMAILYHKRIFIKI